MLPTPLTNQLLIEPIYDPVRIGSIFMPPRAQNDAPSQGLVVGVGPDQTEIELGFRVVVSTREWVKKIQWYELQRDSNLYFYQDREVVAFVSEDGEIYPRAKCVVIIPSWAPSGVVKHGLIYTVDRIFTTPKAPQTGKVLRTGDGVTEVKRGDEVCIPSSGGYETAAKSRVLYVIEEKHILGILTDAVENDSVKSDRSRGAAT